MKWKPINELNRRKSQRVLVAQDGHIALNTWDYIRQIWVSEAGEDVLPRDACGSPTHFAILPDAPA